jgi:hypothetical protein
VKNDAKQKRKGGFVFDDFLSEQGILEECEEQAIKQILAEQIQAAMENERPTKAALQRAALAVGRQPRLELV